MFCGHLTMKTRPNTPLPIRELILQHHSNGESVRTISAVLNVPKSTVNYIIKKFKSGEPIGDKPRSGRPRKTNVHHDKIIIRKSKLDPMLTAVDISLQMKEEYNLNINRISVSRRLRKAGLYARIAAKKPLISNRNRKNRLEFAKKYSSWSVEQWKKVIFSDESKFCLFGSDGRRYTRRPVRSRFDSKYIKPTLKHGGGSVMVWSAFHFNGTCELVKIEGIMKKENYKNILEAFLVPYANENMPEDWIFQQDNDPKHTSKFVKNWLTENNVRLLDWPSQSPDLNPIEHLWDSLGRRIGNRKSQNLSQLFCNLKEEWSKIPNEELEKLVASMPKRLAEVIKNKGGTTGY